MRCLTGAAALTVAVLSLAAPAGAAAARSAVAPASAAAAGPPTPPPPPTSPAIPPIATPPAADQGTGVAPGVATGDGNLTLLNQSPVVETGQSFHLGLAVTAPNPDTRLEVVVYPRLTTRTDFDASLKGKLHNSSDYVLGPHPVSSLAADPTGGVDITIPVNPASASGPDPPLTTRSDSGVFPVQVRLLDHAGNTVGAPLTTFLVYASAAAASSQASPRNGSNGLPRLDVGLTVPVGEAPSLAGDGQPTRLGARSSADLSALAGVLTRHGSVPVTLDVTPQTIDTLAGGTGTDRATLAALGALAVGTTDEVTPATYTSVSLPGLIGAGLGSEVTDQINAGTATLGADLHRSPPPGLWTVNGPIDQTTLESLTTAGASQLVVPSTDLSPVPESFAHTTLAAPTQLTTRSGPPLQVVEADAGLSSHFINGGDTVLAANQLLAELAMIQLETPGETRGVAVLPPAGWKENAAFLDVVLNGLTANPLLAPVTTSTLFSSVPPAAHASTPLVRTLTATRPNVPAFSDALLIRSARAAVDAVGSIFPNDRNRVAVLGRQVLTSEADDLAPGQRNHVAGTVIASLAALRRDITLPGGASITLTARNGGVPVTVIATGVTGAQVSLRLSSDKLIFRPFSPTGGHCTAPSTGVEVCDLALSSEATTLKVPVLARTSGVFALDVTLSSPSGAVRLSDSRATVRSTAFSGVGVILIVVAGLALAYWWVHNIRHGRRARDLIPANVDGHRAMEEGAVPHPGSPPPGPVLPPSLGSPQGSGLDPSLQSGPQTEPVEPSMPFEPDMAVAGGESARTAVSNDDGADDDGAGDDGAGDDGADDDAAHQLVGDARSWLDEDPVIAEFFSSPAPDYPSAAPGRPRSR
ncbi:MAG: DUF6049 family protein [Actinomycetota bacterium]|nr:DUF6049 family protein [Actinomycetota bacterium]